MEDLYPTGISCSDHEIATFTQGPSTSTTTTTTTTTTGGEGRGGGLGGVGVGGGGFHHHHHHHGRQVVVVEKLNHQFQPPNHHHHHDNTDQIRGSEHHHHQIYDDHLIKAQIATHPRYPKLLSAYIECRKVGAPPEMASLLEEISQEIQLNGGCCEIGADPELDDFMESYCEVLIRYKEELSKPFDEATSFLNKIEIQLSNLCKGTSTTTTTTTTTTSGSTHHSDDVAGSSEEELSCGEVEALESQESSGQRSGDQELKEMLLRKYSGYLSSLRKEFLKKRKKGKLPKDARVTLLDWWNTHYRWPYPTEEEKMKLAEVTGLDQKQINNWFINQRKRHWKPSEDMRFALMEGVTGGGGGPPAFFDTGEGPGTDDLS